jgi:hypothetical protein
MKNVGNDEVTFLQITPIGDRWLLLCGQRPTATTYRILLVRQTESLLELLYRWDTDVPPVDVPARRVRSDSETIRLALVAVSLLHLLFDWVT